MITINGEKFYEKPGSCGTCPFFSSGTTYLSSKLGYYPEKGFCSLFLENHKTYINPPKRCQKLFNKAFKMPDGIALVVVQNDSTAQ